ncbi:MAG: hypothetical protein FWF54_10355 [Candidatus Azobacteroides sp.]|nr:hypothetical protein [Candidatus Azobacteroides sp.]
MTNAFIVLGASAIPIVTINNINLINSALILNMGEEGITSDGRYGTWGPIYDFK